MPIHYCYSLTGSEKFLFQRVTVNAETHIWSKGWEPVIIECSVLNETSLSSPWQGWKDCKRKRMERGTKKHCLLIIAWRSKWWTHSKCARERDRQREREGGREEEVRSIDRRRVRKRRRWIGRVMRYECGHKTLCTYNNNQEKDTPAHAAN